MKPISRRSALATLAVIGMAGMRPGQTSAQAAAAKWPIANVKLMVPGPPGGALDALARPTVERLSRHLGAASIIVNNKPGAGGLVGAQWLMGVAPDGENFGILNNGHLTLQAMGAKFDMARDFTPVIGRFAISPIVIAVRADSPHKTFADLVREIQAKPGKLNYGTSGNGTPGHMGFEAIRQRIAGLDAQNVPFKGANGSITALAGGEIDFACALMTAAATMVRSGRVRALAVTSPTRSAVLPQVPTVAESGYAGFSFVNWMGIFAPSKVSPSLITGMRTALLRVASEAEFKASAETLGWDLQPAESSEAFHAFFRQALALESALVKKLGLTMS